MDIFSKMRKASETKKTESHSSKSEEPKKADSPKQEVEPVTIDNKITLMEMREALPAHLRSAVSEEFIDNFNKIATDAVFAETIRDNFVSYSSVLKEGKFKVENYLDAVVYVSHKLSGKTNQDAYIATFPDRYSALISSGKENQLSAYVSQYAAGKLPNLILEQSMIPIHVLNMDVRQKAINRLAHLMTQANSELVQANAATALLTHLKGPEKAAGVNLNVNIDTNDSMLQLQEQLQEMAQKGLQMIDKGLASAKDLAGVTLINHEDVEDAEVIYE